MAWLRHPFPPNPGYGTGCTRRRVRLWNIDGGVEGLLTDVYHQMSCRIQHEGGRVIAIDGESPRVPNTLCSGASGILQELVGWHLDQPALDLYRGGRARRHCTHLFDLAVLAIAHAGRGGNQCQFDAVVPDELDQAVAIEVSLNGEPVHCWQAMNARILAPAELAGRPLTAGFAGWASETFSGVELDAAMVLSRTYLIAGGRAGDTSAWKGRPISDHHALLGSCYAYAPERVARGRFLGNNERDFSGGMDETR